MRALLDTVIDELARDSRAAGTDERAMRDAFHGRFRARELIGRLLPPLRDHTNDPGMVWAREWRDRQVRLEFSGPCPMCRHHETYPTTMPLLPHVYAGEMHG